ncbi:collectin-10-like [Biomphalaria glabrata]|uniref:Collectin-10-like n=1 Tax=Biomphalaria glabrata TaxID=6526 RepID=A0A9U8EF21_BIOGL|nr:collectin-10-like [Biomphalaria glabrata]KAI8778970.1 collectin-10 [Biomphalaria glabrata]
MFDEVTSMCTPGGKLSPLQPGPTLQEGDLYVLPRDDAYEGFSLHTFNLTTVNMAYFYVPVTYLQALEACHCMNSMLYAPKTLDKLELIADLAYTTQHNIWVGLDDLVTEGQFIWSEDGQPFDTSLNSIFFYDDQPDNYLGDEDCISLRYNAHRLNDANCNRPYFFSCEQRT